MLRIFRSSRIEHLATLLWSQLQATQPQNVLAPQTIVLGHLGMKRWLVGELTAKPTLAGAPGIAANLEVLLPGQWLEQLAQAVLHGSKDEALPYRRGALRWRIYRDLPLLEAAAVRHYLDGDGAERRRFQLADRLAGLYEQYQVYRRDWLLAWEGSDASRPGLLGHWQGELWRRLIQGIGVRPRSVRLHELISRLGRIERDANTSTLHVFGLSHLPPDALRALEQLAQAHDVNLYFPDPCRELWDQLRSRHELLRHGMDAEASYLEIGHPLLASLGRLGQHFSVLLHELGGQLEDVRDAWDQEAPALPATTPLLEQLQASIRLLDPGAVASTSAPADASLRIHLTHTRLRELEVLKDALLDFLARDPTLQPREIVVMAPQMADYAPLLPSLFGEAARASGPLPYHLADVALARTHPLLNAFAGLLQLPLQRVSRSQVLGLLALPAVQRRFGITPGGLDALQRWLDRACVAWGLDGPMKADFGAAPIAENSFAFGLDRMFAGYLLGSDDDDLLLDANVLPAAPIQGPDVAVLGALDELLAILREVRTGAREPRLAAAWVAWLERVIGALFVADPDDDAEVDALMELKRLAREPASEIRLAGPDVDPLLPFSVVSEVWRERLEAIPEQQAFLAGGITFCGMVPQRSVPFKVVCILGLADGEFPRARAQSGLDLMQDKPRLGDRDNRMDDRYLFLEALMSARQALHLSFVGEGVRDGKPRNPAAPLAELMTLLDRAQGNTRDAQRNWLIRHALQPFDARYFEQGDAADPRWFSYAQAYAQLAVARVPTPVPGFLEGLESAEAAAPASDTISLDQLERFFKDPARRYCEDVLGLSRRALTRIPDQDLEPLGSTIEKRERRHVQMVWAALEQGATRIPAVAPPALALSGQIAPGALGETAYAHERASAEILLAHARKLAPFSGVGAPVPEPLQVNLELADGSRITGTIERVYRAGDTRWLVAIAGGNVDFRQVLPLFLQWALLRLCSPPEQPCGLALIHEKGEHKVPQDFARDPAQLAAGLDALLALYRDSRLRRPAYLPRTSFALALNREERLTCLEKYWAAKDGGERGYEPGYNELLFGELDPEDPRGSLLRELEDQARQLMQAITGRLILAAAATEPPP